MSIRKINMDELVVDRFGRKCVDCETPLYLKYLRPLKESQTLCKLSDAADEWMDSYESSGDSFDEDVRKSEDNDELYRFLSQIQKLGVAVDARVLSREFVGEFEDAKRRGFLDFLGTSDKAGEYIMICPNRRCKGKKMGNSPTYPTHPDQRGKHININEDGSQDKYEKVFNPEDVKLGERTCPNCGDPFLFKDHIDPDTGRNVYNCSRCGNDYIENESGGFNKFYF